MNTTRLGFLKGLGAAVLGLPLLAARGLSTLAQDTGKAAFHPHWIRLVWPTVPKADVYQVRSTGGCYGYGRLSHLLEGNSFSVWVDSTDTRFEVLAFVNRTARLIPHTVTAA